ncbi:MAG: protease family protein [Verrucomicrobiota bacterium]|jgi:membrane protease YdiL (CAAX protease family)
MLAGALSGALWTLLGSLIVLAAAFVYVTLFRQINARSLVASPEIDPAPKKTFGLPEAFLATGLILFLLTSVTASFGRRSPVQLGSRDLIVNVLITLFIVFFIAAFLKLRGIDIESVAGFSRTTLKRALSTAVVLLLAATPLILLAEALTQNAFGSGSSKQEIVDLFNTSRTIGQRVTIIVLAVVVAPMSEEFIFRFFIYGVVRRYFGVGIGLVFNSMLFAAAHVHLPSAVPLFVLGGCLTLAYEWSGSILVCMAMHALFNSVQLIFLAFPELVQQ